MLLFSALLSCFLSLSHSPPGPGCLGYFQDLTFTDNVPQTSAYTHASISPGKITGKRIVGSWLCTYSDGAELSPECFYQFTFPSAMEKNSNSPHTSPVCQYCETFSVWLIGGVSGARSWSCDLICTSSMFSKTEHFAYICWQWVSSL